MSHLGGPLPKNEDEKEKMKIGYRYGEARDKFLDKLPVVGALRENQRNIAKFEAEQYAKREAEGGVGNWLLNRYSDIPDVAGQVLASPFTAVSEVFNIDPRLLGDATLALGVGAKGLSKLKPKHLGISQTYERLPNRIDAAPPPRKLINVTKSNAYQELVKDYPANSMGGFVPKAALASETYGGLAKKYPFLLKNRPAEGYSFAYDTSDAEVAYPGNIAKRKAIRERIMSNSPDAIAYRELLDKHKAILKDVEPTIIDKQEMKVSPLSQEELIEDVRQLTTLKKALKLPNAKSYQKELGAFIGDDGSVFRYSETQDKLVSTKAIKKRQANQATLPTTKDFDPHLEKYGPFVNSLRQEAVTKQGLKSPEKDHTVRLENQIAILGKSFNNGEFTDRSPEFIDQTARIITQRGHNLGDVNLNFIAMSDEAHRTLPKSRHVVSQALTDAELPHTYAEADQIFTTLTDGTQKWLNVERKGKSFILKDGDTVVPNKLIESKGNYKFAGREYEKGQRQGLSLDTRKILGSITDPKELADAYIMFVEDAGAHEIMSGIQTAASFLYDDPSKLDALSKKIRDDNIPNMIKFLKYALKETEYKGDVEYTNLLNRFIDRLEMNRQEYFKLLERDATRPSLFKNSLSSIIDLNDPAMA